MNLIGVFWVGIFWNFKAEPSSVVVQAYILVCAQPSRKPRYKIRDKEHYLSVLAKEVTFSCQSYFLT